MRGQEFPTRREQNNSIDAHIRLSISHGVLERARTASTGTQSRNLLFATQVLFHKGKRVMRAFKQITTYIYNCLPCLAYFYRSLNAFLNFHLFYFISALENTKLTIKEDFKFQKLPQGSVK
jgi:hypothetical protein